MREYELTVITKSELPDAEKSKVLQTYEEILARSGGIVLKKEDMGSKRLAFPINKQFRGNYVFYDLTSSASDVAEAERLMRLDENVLRYLVVKIDDDVNVEDRRAQLLKAAQQLQQQDQHH